MPTAFREDIVKRMNEGVASRYLGQDKTLNHLKERFYYNDICDWCQTCATFASRKMPTRSVSAGYPTQIMAVDLDGPLPGSDSENVYIMAVGDYFPTGWKLCQCQIKKLAQ